MGSFFSKSKKNRPNQGGYAPIPASAPTQKIDPRDQRPPPYHQHQQHQLYQPPQPYAQPLSAQTQQPPPSTVARLTGKRLASKKIKPEYVLRVACLDCAKRGKDCLITPDLNGNVLDGRRHAYRDPTYAGGRPQPWTLAIDFCGQFSWRQREVVVAALKRVCGGGAGGDRAYEADEGLGSSYGGGGVCSAWSHGRAGGKPAGGAVPGPFQVDVLLGELREKNVRFESSV